MKGISLLIFIVVNVVYADMWRKPEYVPDENHLPPNNIQKQENKLLGRRFNARKVPRTKARHQKNGAESKGYK